MQSRPRFIRGETGMVRVASKQVARRRLHRAIMRDRCDRYSAIEQHTRISFQGPASVKPEASP
jgi:hypothetical protein